MKIKGVFKLEDGNKVFETHEKLVTCTSCLKKLKNGEMVYVCELMKYVYCNCHSLRNSSVCRAMFTARRKEHQDILCKLVIIKS